jgi:site-specific DNA-methyltransferase (adenine-specific)
VYGSGFPKSLDVSKAIDKSAGAERKSTPVGNVVKRMIPGADQNATGSWIKDNGREYQPSVSVPSTDEAKQWEGWGTALKPALEPITVARKPLEEKTVAANVLKYGTGAINIDASRVPHMGEKLGGGNNSAEVDRSGKHEGWQRPWMQDADAVTISAERSLASTARSETLGRFPANFIHDGSEEVTGLLEESARFFYCAKTSKKDRNEGMEGMAEHRKAGAEFRPNHTSKADAGETGNPYGRWNTATNFHPTVKPTDLMRYLCRLVTPPNGIVLDPFMGSGSTGKAAVLENFRFVGIELDPNYMKIAEARIESADPTDYEEDPVEKESVGLEKFIE